MLCPHPEWLACHSLWQHDRCAFLVAWSCLKFGGLWEASSCEIEHDDLLVLSYACWQAACREEGSSSWQIGLKIK